MAMHNPPHPGEFIAESYMKPFDISCRALAIHTVSGAYDELVCILRHLLKSQKTPCRSW